VTRSELTALEVLIGEFRQFRDNDAEWKDSFDVRMRAVEAHVTGRKAVEARRVALIAGRRAYIAAVTAAIGVIASTVLGIYNALN
jgi:hypothetical protein